MTDDFLISLNKVSKLYESKNAKPYQALTEIDLSIKKGSFCFLKGVSGSGKTTLLNIIGGILSPSSGSVTLMGYDFYHLSDNKQSQFRKDHIGFIFQNFLLIPNLTVYENVTLPLNLQRERKDSYDVNYVLELLGLYEHRHKYPSQISGGQQQRVSIARALVKKPSYIIADEPTANLDSNNSTLVTKCLVKVNEELNQTIILSTHDDSLQEMLNDKVIYHINDGKVKL